MKDVTTFIKTFNSKFRRGSQRTDRLRLWAWMALSDDLTPEEIKKDVEKFNKKTGREAINKIIKETLEKRKE